MEVDSPQADDTRSSAPTSSPPPAAVAKPKKAKPERPLHVAFLRDNSRSLARVIQQTAESEPINELDLALEDALAGPSTSRPLIKTLTSRTFDDEGSESSYASSRTSKKAKPVKDKVTPIKKVSHPVDTPSRQLTSLQPRAQQAVVDAQTADEDVYCLCQEEADEGTTMIECEAQAAGCRLWYHTACVDIDDRTVELLDRYICEICEKNPSVSDRTIFRAKCKRDDCWRAAQVPASKYCSEPCGVRVTLARLKSKGIAADRIIDAVKDAIKPEGYAVRAGDERSTSWTAAAKRLDNEQRLARIATLRADRDRLQALDEEIHKQATALQGAIAAADALPLVKLSSDNVPGKQKKRKGSSSNAEDRPCGYPTPPDDVVCMRPRRRCENHFGWQKIRNADLELQADITSHKLDAVQKELQALEAM